MRRGICSTDKEAFLYFLGMNFETHRHLGLDKENFNMVIIINIDNLFIEKLQTVCSLIFDEETLRYGL